MPGIGEDIEGAIQHAPQPGRQDVIVMVNKEMTTFNMRDRYEIDCAFYGPDSTRWNLLLFFRFGKIINRTVALNLYHCLRYTHPDLELNPRTRWNNIFR